MKHIVVAVTNDLSFDQRMIRSCTALVDAGYKVTFVGRELANSNALLKKPFEQLRLKCTFNNGPLFYAEFQYRLKRFLSKLDFDLAIACDLDTIMAISMASSSKHRPFIFDSHELFTEVPELDGRDAVKNIWTRIGKKYVPKAVACISVGEAISEELSKKYKRAFQTVRNVPQRSDAPMLSWDERDAVIFYQGALNEGRGLEALIDAMQNIDGYTLQLAGEGDLSEALRERVNAKGLENKVQFLGRISPEELPAIASLARIGINVLESRSRSYYFSLANKFFDYMQAGTPSVNMNFPEYSGILKDHETGVMIKELTADAISSEMNLLLNDRNKWQTLSSNCGPARALYCWENEKQILLDICHRATT